MQITQKLIQLLMSKIKKKNELIRQIKFNDNIDFSSSGYAAQLFSIFNNKLDF